MIRVVIGVALWYVAWRCVADRSEFTVPDVVSFVSLVIGIVAFVTGMVG